MIQKHNIKAILADIDGTVSPPKGNSRDLFWLQRLRQYCDWVKTKKLSPFAIATGRNRSYVEDLLQCLGIPADIPHIVENGAALYLADTDQLIPHPLCSGFEEARHAIADVIQSIVRDTGCYEDREKVFMFTLYPGPISDIASLYEIAKSRLSLFTDVVDIMYSSSAVDIMPKGVDKAAGLAFFCERVGISQADVLAIGDSHNDYPLIAAAGYAACPGNATDEIKKLVAEKQEHGFAARANTTIGVVRALEHFFGIELPDPRLRKLSLEMALRQKQEVMCALVPGTNVGIGDRYLHIVIPDDPFIANTKDQMAAISGNSNGDHFRWAAGGIAPVLVTPNGIYLITLFRDEGAMTWPNTLTIPTGLSSDSSEFVDFFSTMLREGFEELLIRTPKGLFAPKNTSIENTIAIASIAENGLHLGREFWPSMRQHIDWIPTDVMRTDHDFSVTVEWRGKKRTQSALVTIHEITSGIDVVKVVRINSPYTIEELSIADGEETPHGSLLNRHVYLLSLEEVKRWVDEGGDLCASHHFVSGKNLGHVTLTGIKPLPFLTDAMRAIAATFP